MAGATMAIGHRRDAIMESPTTCSTGTPRGICAILRITVSGSFRASSVALEPMRTALSPPTTSWTAPTPGMSSETADGSRTLRFLFLRN